MVTLRELHATLDRTVLDAYGWQDIHPVYDYRVQLDERTRYTWDEATHDEVLARLLEENRKRAGMSALVPVTKPPVKPKTRGKKGENGPPTTLPGVG